MEGFSLDSMHECEHIISAPDVFLETSRTGVHYRLSRFHTDTCYRLSPVMGVGSHREIFSRRLVDEMGDQGIDCGEIGAFVATGVDGALLASTLQHYRTFKKQPRLTYVYEQDGALALREGFSFEKDEKVWVISPAAIRFRRIAQTIDLIQRAGSHPDHQPCVDGCMVLLDRSPVGLDWRRGLCAYRFIVGMRKPIVAYPTNPKICPFCIQGVPIGDWTETA